MSGSLDNSKIWNEQNTELLYLDRQVIVELSTHFGYDVSENLLQALRRWQLEKLHQTLIYAQQNCSAYNQVLAHYCKQKNPKTCNQSYADLDKSIKHILSKLEFTHKEQLTKCPESYLAQKLEQITTIVPNTEHTKRIYYSQNDIDRAISFFKEAMHYMLRVDNQEKVGILLSNNSPASFSQLIQKSLAANSIAYILLDSNIDNLCSEFCEAQCQVLLTSPSQAKKLSQLKDVHKICRSLQNVLLLGEAVSASLRQELNQALGANIFVHYGLGEINHVGAIECSINHGCHLRELDLWVEIVNSENIPLNSGLWGEIVITTLNQEAMPLIRYKTGDFGRILPTPCPCGSVLKRIESQGKIETFTF